MYGMYGICGEVDNKQNIGILVVLDSARQALDVGFVRNYRANCKVIKGGGVNQRGQPCDPKITPFEV